MIKKLFKYLLQAVRQNPKIQQYSKSHKFKEQQSGNGYLLVDVTISNPSYILGNLLTAYYLSLKYKTEIVALYSNPFETKYRGLIKSFGVKKFIYTDVRYITNRYVKYKNQARSSFNAEEILDIEFQGIRVGDLIYDTYIRESGHGTLKDMNWVNQIVDQAKIYYDYYNTKLIQEYKIKYFVTGHIVYNRLGLAARIVLNNNGHVFAKKYGGGPFTIRWYKQFEEIYSYEYKFSKDEFEGYKKGKEKDLIRRGQQYIEDRFKGEATKEDLNVKAAFGGDKRLVSKEELSNIVGFNPTNKIGVIMSHVLPDAPHSNAWMIHDDYYKWLKSVLSIVEGAKDMNWLIKPHPANKFYSDKDEVLELVEPYLTKQHIALCPEYVNTASLKNIASLIVTCNGTSGLEFSALGIPCVLAGDSPYSELGFTLEPSTEEQLKQILLTGESIPLLEKEEVDNALMFCVLHYLDSRLPSVFIPNVTATFWEELDEDAFWESALDKLQFQLVEDPFYVALAHQIEKNNPHLLKIG